MHIDYQFNMATELEEKQEQEPGVVKESSNSDARPKEKDEARSCSEYFVQDRQ